jgi:hypothetical protein
LTFVIIVGGFQKALHYVFAIKIPIISYTEARIDLCYDLPDGLFGGPAPNASLHRGGTLPLSPALREEARNGGRCLPAGLFGGSPEFLIDVSHVYTL